MNHIVYVCDRVEPVSGWGVLNYNTILEAQAAGNKVTVFYTKGTVPAHVPEVNYYPILTSKTLKVFKLPFALIDILKIKYLLVKQQIAVDFVHVLVEPYIPLVLAFPRNSKKVLSIIGTYSLLSFQSGSLLTNYVNRFCVKRFNQGVSISDYSKKVFSDQRLGLEDIFVCGEGVDYEGYKVFQGASKEFYFIIVAPQLKPRKGIIYALKAFCMCLERHPSLKLHIVSTLSNSSYEIECKKYIEDKGLTDAIVWHGRIEASDLYSLYGSAISNILPSVNDGVHFEGYGNVHIEANAVGTLTIGSRNCGNETAIIDGETGFLCSQKDTNDIHSKMLKVIDLYKNKELEGYSRRCIKHAQENTWEKYFARLMRNCYRD